MPEGAVIAGTVAEATFDNPRVQPPEDAKAAPWGWTWDTKARRWRPRKSAGRAGAKARAGGPRQKAPSEPEIPQPSLDDFDDDGEPNGDPDPAWFRENASRDSSASKGAFRLEDVPKQVKDDLAGVLGFAGTMLLPVVESIDPYCGRAVSENYARIVDACVPLMCRSERVIKWMTSTGGGFMDYVALGLALAPVGKAIADHHIFRTVDVVRDEATGQLHVVRRERGTQHTGDHLTPPQPQMQYAA